MKRNYGFDAVWQILSWNVNIVMEHAFKDEILEVKYDEKNISDILHDS